jgi:hypothetical protein
MPLTVAQVLCLCSVGFHLASQPKPVIPTEVARRDLPRVLRAGPRSGGSWRPTIPSPTDPVAQLSRLSARVLERSSIRMGLGFCSSRFSGFPALSASLIPESPLFNSDSPSPLPLAGPESRRATFPTRPIDKIHPKFAFAVFSPCLYTLLMIHNSHHACLCCCTLVSSGVGG